MRKPLVPIAALSLFAMVVTACGSDATPGSSAAGRISVVTTTTQLTDFARVIGGQYVSVYGVLKANVDPHDYEPSPSDVQQLSDADVIIKNGVGLEQWFEDTITSAEPKGKIVDASRGVAIRRGNGTADEKQGDPHMWQSPANAEIMVHDVTLAFAKAAPTHRAFFEQRERVYDAQLRALDTQIRVELAPITNRRVVTNHDAFGYYLARYHLIFEGSIIPSFDTQAELSATDLQQLVARIRKTGVKAVFSESSLPAKTAATIGREAGVKVVAGDNALYGDTLGPPGSDGDTYLKMMRHNTREFVDNLD
jgi:ABC-type Zn uptake system ZnuABC Zn-binding protein ZnuA